MNKISISVLSIFSLLFLFSCSNQKEGFKVAATSVPHAQLLEFVKSDLKTQGIDLNIIVMDDFNIPNRALANHEVDANFFQHIPFLQEQMKHFNYPFEVLAKVEIEPMGVYSKKIESLKDLKNHSTITIPNDPTNESRALLMLEENGIIKLDKSNGMHATVLNVVSNPKQLKILEIEAAMLPRSLEDVDAAIINTNYALEAGLSPLRDALALEDENSPYANVIVIRKGDANRPEIKALKAAMTSEKMREFILKKYRGAISPAF